MNQWLRMTLSNGTESAADVLPPAETDVGLYLIPHRRMRAWTCDFGRVYFQRNVPYWESAFGIGSRLDGRRIYALLREYEIWFAGLPPLLNGRVPPGFTKETRKE